uniref:Uncharacterized protein n=1 Tax=Panagrellus redivivus TaxID=6233 RepID=A0A7E4UNM4_PANRE
MRERQKFRQFDQMKLDDSPSVYASKSQPPTLKPQPIDAIKSTNPATPMPSAVFHSFAIDNCKSYWSAENLSPFCAMVSSQSPAKPIANPNRRPSL